ncbi:hypothetical protein VP1G_10601 [Cytospora mali]|uniref:Uncharacterized protein n=1 Tax=Cytospora mali TaxID=578113 RepID=A0A194UPC0_CYTMA|nr:hypothetical protein VP1G_10601 [Valsa mali var. pyri (nom. inval.)]
MYKKASEACPAPAGSTLQVIAQLLVPAREEHLLLLVPPDQHADLLGVRRQGVVLGLGVEVLEQEALGRLHPLVLQLPEADLVDHGGRQHGLLVRLGDAVHLLVRVRRQVRHDLVRRDAVADGLPDRVARQAARHHAREPVAQVAEQREDRDLQRGGRVCVDAVVGLEDDEALVLAAAAAAFPVACACPCAAARTCYGGVEARRDAAER